MKIPAKLFIPTALLLVLTLLSSCRSEEPKKAEQNYLDLDDYKNEKKNCERCSTLYSSVRKALSLYLAPFYTTYLLKYALHFIMSSYPYIKDN